MRADNLEANVSKVSYFNYGINGISGFTLSDEVNQTTTEYFYRKNVQGDVTHIFDIDMNLAAKYEYDAWGNHTVTEYSEDNIGALNPIRYRGYYYDIETGLFYLKSRYYDPETGRFINADDPSVLDLTRGDTNGFNLYAYCLNNPVNNVDPSGRFVLTAVVVGLIIGAIIGATVGGIVAYDIASESGATGWELFGWTMLGAIGGGIIGGAIGAGIGYGLGLAFPAINTFLASSFTIGGGIGGGFALAGGGVLGGGVAISVSTVVAAGAAVAGAIGAGMLLYKYDRKYVAPRIKNGSRKEAYDKAFQKGGKKEPRLDYNDPRGPHYHPADPRFSHWHYYFGYILWLIKGLFIDDDE